jgi:hypothetical protein
MARSQSGQATVARPAPDRIAAMADIAIAPVIPRDPPISKSDPNIYLWEFSGLGGRISDSFLPRMYGISTVFIALRINFLQKYIIQLCQAENIC